jgi:hypothetical protein
MKDFGIAIDDRTCVGIDAAVEMHQVLASGYFGSSIKRIVLSSNLGALGDLAVQPCSRYTNRQDAKVAKEKEK